MVDRAAAAVGTLQTELGVPVDVRGAIDPTDSACSRDNCVNPMRAGARIYKGAIDTYPECTMAFHQARSRPIADRQR